MKLKEKYKEFERKHKWVCMGVGWALAIGVHVGLGEAAVRFLPNLSEQDKKIMKRTESLIVAADIGAAAMMVSYERDISKMDKSFQKLKEAFNEVCEIYYEDTGTNPFASYDIEVTEVGV